MINALQNLLFCIPKAAVLHGKSVGFASQNSRFRSAKSKLAFFVRIIFTKQPCKRNDAETTKSPHPTNSE
ncbi:hypothetical protein CTM63_10945 [Prevotella intermedia]|uniref:hypothetical protein n=1 Tax=Prevotella intermedia TaxID=28131 RepID=UPI000C1C70BB|nr:hypothetical protein [Prevotella intermedia]ATV29719.1 hypothetical protein CTM63_10945 [Prevotella intermedia]